MSSLRPHFLAGDNTDKSMPGLLHIKANGGGLGGRGICHLLCQLVPQRRVMSLPDVHFNFTGV